jgi:vacuolar-type H+-ATPase subunit H
LDRLLRLPGLSGAGAGLAAVAGIATIGALIAAVVIAGPWQAGTGPTGASVPPQRAVSSNVGARTSTGAIGAGKGAAVESTASAPGGADSNAPAASGVAAASGRIQQLAASISLSAIPSEVQTVADRVTHLAVSFGGFVQSSQVQVQHEGSSRGELDLRLPSAKLSGALASLGQLAPVLAESQSLQDITNTYDAARQRLSDATAERRALLRALSRATTEGQIDSLHERISQNRGAIAQARSALQTVSQHASTAEVEVTVLGDAHTGSEGLTLHRGFHDAGRVLLVTLVIVLIAAAILVPLALLAAALAAARRMWLRYQRERILDTR